MSTDTEHTATARPFTWMPAAGLRHATAHEKPARGDAITTLCGQFLLADGWNELAPVAPPFPYPFPDTPRLWATCWDCDDVWRQAQEMAAADGRGR